MSNEANTKRQRRTPEQIVSDMEAQLEKARQRAIKAAAKDHPELANLRNEIEALRKAIRSADVVLGKGPQSAQARREKHEAWIEKINQQEAEARDARESGKERLDELQAKLDARASELAAEA